MSDSVQNPEALETTGPVFGTPVTKYAKAGGDYIKLKNDDRFYCVTGTALASDTKGNLKDDGRHRLRMRLRARRRLAMNDQ